MENCGRAGGGAIITLGHNLENGSTCMLTDPTDIHANPLLGPLANNGGPTDTHALLAGSPAIDAGDSANCPSPDQRGVSRPQAEGCDIGAFEAVAVADLSIAKAAAPNPIPLHGTLTYTLTVRNAGPNTVRDVAVTDQLPTSATLVAASSPGGCTASATIGCAVGTLAPGGAATLTIVVRPQAVGALTNSATVSSSATELNAANNTARVTTQVVTPGVSRLRISPATFALGTALPRLTRAPKTSTTISFSLSQPAKVTFTFLRPTAGRAVGRRCVRPTRSNRRRRHCTRYVSAGSLTLQAAAGKRKLRFAGRLSRRRALRPGRYRLSVVAVDSVGNRSAPRQVNFKLLPAPRRRR
jgi:uncharacterized repeat protein (TIGR01451 family)